MRVAILAAAALACVAMAGCNPAQFDASVQQNLPKICDRGAQAHAAFIVLAATGKIKQAVIDKEGKAWASLSVFCDNPKSVNQNTILVKGAEAMAAWVSAGIKL